MSLLEEALLLQRAAHDLKFYSKYGWQLIPKQALILEPGHDSINTMLFNCHVDGVLEYKDKLF